MENTSKVSFNQLEFAKIFGFNLLTLQQWEQARRRPHGTSLVLLKVVDYTADVVRKTLHH